MVDVDAVDRHARRFEGVLLGGEILLVGRIPSSGRAFLGL
jgi:hypothetical protein